MIRKLKAKAKDPQQLELERKEQGFSLYVNGAHSEHGKKRSPPSASRSTKTAGGQFLVYSAIRLYIITLLTQRWMDWYDSLIYINWSYLSAGVIHILRYDRIQQNVHAEL